MAIPVSKNGQLRSYWNTLWGNGLTRTYAPGNLLLTAAQTGGNSASPGAVFNPPGVNQVGDPRANNVGFYNTNISAQTQNALAGIGGTQNVGGNSFVAPVVSAFNSGLLIPLAVLAFALWLILRGK